MTSFKSHNSPPRDDTMKPFSKLPLLILQMFSLRGLEPAYQVRSGVVLDIACNGEIEREQYKFPLKRKLASGQ